MTRRECLKETVRQLEPITEEAEAEARVMLAYLFRCELGELYLYGTKELTKGEQTEWTRILSQRKTGQPLAYVLGERWFMGFPFEVTPDVLIPRQDTELLAETALTLIEKEGIEKILELCTGSGCVAVSVAKLSGKRVDALDISEKALKMAEKNAIKNRADVRFFQSDLFENVSGKYGMILANPPYISREEYQTLPEQVRDYEPRLALYAEDGLVFYRKIIHDINKYLLPGGWLIVEIGYRQGEDVAALMRRAGLEQIQIKQDLSGYDRVVFGRRKETREENHV